MQLKVSFPGREEQTNDIEKCPSSRSAVAVEASHAPVSRRGLCITGHGIRERVSSAAACVLSPVALHIFPFRHYCRYFGRVGIAAFCTRVLPSFPAWQFLELCQENALDPPIFLNPAGTSPSLFLDRSVALGTPGAHQAFRAALKSFLLPDHIEQRAVTFRCSSHALKHRPPPNAVRFHERIIPRLLQNISQHSL